MPYWLSSADRLEHIAIYGTYVISSEAVFGWMGAVVCVSDEILLAFRHWTVGGDQGAGSRSARPPGGDADAGVAMPGDDGTANEASRNRGLRIRRLGLQRPQSVYRIGSNR
jgi:hypothetical protein